MSERIDVVNIALNLLGEAPITSIDDDSDSARAMKVNYIHSRDATLEAHTWTFAMKRFIPAKLAESPEFGPPNAFAIPSDILRVTSVWDEERHWRKSFSSRSVDRDQAQWDIESRTIVTDSDPIFCIGIRRIDDEGIYSPLFVQAFAAQLAFMCAYLVTESNQKVSTMAALYEQRINDARSRDGQQGRNRRIRNTSLTRSRYSVSNIRGW
jgi:hypothetical protein